MSRVWDRLSLLRSSRFWRPSSLLPISAEPASPVQVRHTDTRARGK